MTTRNSKASSVREIWSLLDRTGFAISRLRELELGKYGLTIEQSSILYILTNSKEGFVTPGELENITMRQHHSISVLTSGMESSGLVQKVKYPDGKRIKIVITPEGFEGYQATTIASLEESFSALEEKGWGDISVYLTDLLLKSRQLLGLPTDISVRIINENANHKYAIHIHELWTLLDRTRFAISRLRGLELAHFGLTIEQASILNILSNRDSTTAKDLENISMRRQHSISSLLKGMIKMGIVTRSKGGTEKCFRIVITPSGKQLYESLTVTSLEEVLLVLTQSEKQTMAALLDVLLIRARYLLGISYQPPFLQHLIDGKTKIIVS
jgi:DNA-binding MarR family transcriptional regulator